MAGSLLYSFTPPPTTPSSLPSPPHSLLLCLLLLLTPMPSPLLFFQDSPHALTQSSSSALFVGADLVDLLVYQLRGALKNATMSGEKIRQCSCAEQSSCFDEMGVQLWACEDECWHKWAVVTNRTEELRFCFYRTDSLLNDLFTCVDENLNSCVAKPDDSVLIQRVNISKGIELAAEKAHHLQQRLSRTIARPVRAVMDAVGGFAGCLKGCFLEKNRGGFCFDKKECQPLLVEKHVKHSVRHCLAQADWREEAGRLCECMVNAGVRALHAYCPMLQMLGQQNRRGGGKKKSGKE